MRSSFVASAKVIRPQEHAHRFSDTHTHEHKHTYTIFSLSLHWKYVKCFHLSSKIVHIQFVHIDSPFCHQLALFRSIHSSVEFEWNLFLFVNVSSFTLSRREYLSQIEMKNCSVTVNIIHQFIYIYFIFTLRKRVSPVMRSSLLTLDTNWKK